MEKIVNDKQMERHKQQSFTIPEDLYKKLIQLENERFKLNNGKYKKCSADHIKNQLCQFRAKNANTKSTPKNEYIPGPGEYNSHKNNSIEVVDPSQMHSAFSSKSARDLHFQVPPVYSEPKSVKLALEVCNENELTINSSDCDLKRWPSSLNLPSVQQSPQICVNRPFHCSASRNLLHNTKKETCNITKEICRSLSGKRANSPSTFNRAKYECSLLPHDYKQRANIGPVTYNIKYPWEIYEREASHKQVSFAVSSKKGLNWSLPPEDEAQVIHSIYHQKGRKKVLRKQTRKLNQMKKYIEIDNKNTIDIELDSEEVDKFDAFSWMRTQPDGEEKVMKILSRIGEIDHSPQQSAPKNEVDEMDDVGRVKVTCRMLYTPNFPANSRLSSGSCITFCVHLRRSVLELKKKISRKQGHPTHSIQIKFNGVFLNNDMHLLEAGIKERSTVLCIFI